MPTITIHPSVHNPALLLAYLSGSHGDQHDESTMETIDFRPLIAMTDKLVATGAIRPSERSGKQSYGIPVLPSLRRDFSESSEA